MMDRFVVSKTAPTSLSQRDALSAALLAKAKSANNSNSNSNSNSIANNNSNNNSNSNNSNGKCIDTTRSKRGRDAKEVGDGNDSWDSYLPGLIPAVSSAEISISHSKRKLDSEKSLKGWRIKDGVKVYQTFRAGKLVSACGQEAFRLSKADDDGKKNGKGISKDAGTEKEKNSINVNQGGLVGNSKESSTSREPPKKKESNSFNIFEF